MTNREIDNYEKEIKKLNISISDLEQLLIDQSKQIEQFLKLLYQVEQGMDEYWMEQNPEIVKEIRTILK